METTKKFKDQKPGIYETPEEGTLVHWDVTKVTASISKKLIKEK